MCVCVCVCVCVYVCVCVCVKLKTVDPDETAHQPFHRDLRCLQKPFIIARGSERINLEPVIVRFTNGI